MFQAFAAVGFIAVACVPPVFVPPAVAGSVTDPDPGSDAFLTPGSGKLGWVKNSGSGSGMNNLNHIFESLETNCLGLKYFKFFDAHPGRKKFGSGINIPDPQHWLLASL